MDQAAGTITVVQEGRFRLVTADGQARLFLLAPSSGIEAQDLLDMERDQTWAEVDYEEADDLIAAVATAVRKATAQRRGPS